MYIRVITIIFKLEYQNININLIIPALKNLNNLQDYVSDLYNIMRKKHEIIRKYKYKHLYINLTIIIMVMALSMYEIEHQIYSFVFQYLVISQFR